MDVCTSALEAGVSVQAMTCPVCHVPQLCSTTDSTERVCSCGAKCAIDSGVLINPLAPLCTKDGILVVSK